MPASFPVPIQEDIRDLLMDLLGRGTAVDKVAPLELEEDQPAVEAVVTQRGGPHGVVLEQHVQRRPGSLPEPLGHRRRGAHGCTCRCRDCGATGSGWAAGEQATR